MKIRNLVYTLALASLMASCSDIPSAYRENVEIALSKANTNASSFEQAFKELPAEQKEGLAFLVAHMPQRDLDSLSTEFLVENIGLAYQAKKEFAWTKALPDSIFLNDVLPYASVNERRDNWRADFYSRFSPKVKDAKNIHEALLAVNKSIMEEVKVIYSTKRPKADQSPYESMEAGLASCSGLSILLVDAFRAVGIPARFAGTPNWTTKVGNHSWVEVFVDGKWQFTEYYYPGQLDDAWFLGDAGQANEKDPKYWVYAASFKDQPYHFPLVWDENITYVPAENVTSRYIQLYKEKQAKEAAKNGGLPLHILLFKDQSCAPGDGRVMQEVVVKVAGKEVAKGKTAAPQEDMNKFFSFSLPQDTEFTVEFKDGRGLKKIKKFKATEENEQFRLYVNE